MKVTPGQVRLNDPWRAYASLTVDRQVTHPDHAAWASYYWRRQTVGTVFKHIQDMTFATRLSVGPDAFKAFGPFQSTRDAVAFAQFRYGEKLDLKLYAVDYERSEMRYEFNGSTISNEWTNTAR